MTDTSWPSTDKNVYLFYLKLTEEQWTEILPFVFVGVVVTGSVDQGKFKSTATIRFKIKVLTVNVP